MHINSNVSPTVSNDHEEQQQKMQDNVYRKKEKVEKGIHDGVCQPPIQE